MTASALPLQLKPMTQVRLLDSGDRCDELRVILQSDGPGLLEVPESDAPRIAIHVGKPVRMDCKHGRTSHSGLAIHGDIDIIPEGVPCSWEMKETDAALILKVGLPLLRQVAEESGFGGSLPIGSRFRVRDSHIEHIAWALMAEMQQGFPSGRLFMDCMARSLAVQLLRNHSSAAKSRPLPNGVMSRYRLRQVQSYIEENLRNNLSLQAIADALGMSASHLKVTFRQATGIPVHQYVVQRRVDHAARLLREGKLPISQIAPEVGFAHQSHLEMHVKRLLGVSPRHLRGANRACAR